MSVDPGDKRRHFRVNTAADQIIQRHERLTDLEDILACSGADSKLSARVQAER